MQLQVLQRKIIFLICLMDIQYGCADDVCSTPAKNAAVLSLACNAATNTVVAGTELVSSQATVVFW